MTEKRRQAASAYGFFYLPLQPHGGSERLWQVCSYQAIQQRQAASKDISN